jgi:CubicO group peptidase (beta-lactamase class C family)
MLRVNFTSRWPSRGCLTLLGLVLLGPTASSQQRPSVNAHVIPFVEKGALAGAVMLVADKEKTLAVETAGYSDVAAKTPIKATDLFWIASMSKPVTGTALMVVVDEGKVQLDDPVEKYLPEFKGTWMIAEQDSNHQLLRRPLRPIIVRDLLRHTSGLPFASAMEAPTLDGLPLPVAVRSYGMTPLIYEPGTKYQYSNAGINTAARIIEVVTNQSFEDFLQTRFFDPLGMKDTTFWPNDEQVKRVVKAYSPTEDKQGLKEIKISQLTYPLNDRSRGPMPAGGLFSTAADLGVFCQMVLNKGEWKGRRYLSEKAIEEMGRRQTPEGIKESYGLGWSVGDGTLGHGGALSTNMNIDLKKGIATVWLVQHGGFPQDGDKAHGAFVQAANQLAASK